MALFTLSLAIIIPNTIQSQACSSHDDCPSTVPFCSLYWDSTCHPCDECWYCDEGIDGTCGPCGDGYPTQESPCTTTTTTVTPDFQLVQCGETETGTISSDETVHFQFVNEQVQDVTFTNCQSDFDPTLYLYDSNNNKIQQQSTNDCNGDDCKDDAICSQGFRETFTMENLAAGTYRLKLQPYDEGGEYEVEVFCGTQSPTSPPVEAIAASPATPTMTSTAFPTRAPTRKPSFLMTTCNATNDCHIMCHEDWSCASMIVNGSLASNLYIECFGPNACAEMQIVSGPTDYLYLSCDAEWNQSSCSGSVIDVIDTLSVDIECGRGGCWYINVATRNVINVNVQSDHGGSPSSSYSIFNTSTAVFDCSLGFCFWSSSLYFNDVNDITINAQKTLALYGGVIDVLSNGKRFGNFELNCGDLWGCYNAEVHAKEYLSRYVLFSFD